MASAEDQAGELLDDLYCVVVLDTYSRPNMSFKDCRKTQKYSV